MTESRSGTVVATGLIAVLLIGMALGAVVTLIVVASDPSSNPLPRVERHAVLPRPAPPLPIAAPAPSPPSYVPPPAVEPVAPPEPAAPPPLRTMSSPEPIGDYVVQAGAFSSRARAEQFARRLTAAGHPATVQVESALRRAPNVVLLDEGFANPSAAQAVVQWLRQNEHIVAIVTRRPADKP